MLESLFLLVAVIGFVILWQRIQKLEASLSEVRDFLHEVEFAVQPRQNEEESERGGAGQSAAAPTAAVQRKNTAIPKSASGVTLVGKTASDEAAQSDPPAEELPRQAEDVPPRDAQAENAQAEDAQTEDAQAEDAQVEVTSTAQPPDVALNEESASPGLLSRFSFDFEELVGRRLSVWAGGIALAISGIFLVIYSIEQGLLSPMVRVALSFAFGLALLAGAELAHHFEQRLADPRVRQALAGAGLATLYAAFYLAGTTYGLIGAGAAFLGLAAVTAGAIGLSYRYGLPCAILGLVGGFAAPAMVTTAEPNIALLSVYLGLVTAGLAYTGKRQDRPWLSLAALGGGFLWGLVLLIGGVESNSDVASVGFLIIGLGALIPLLLSSMSPRPLARLGAAAIASLQMAGLVFQAGFAPLTWGLYLLLGAALAALAWSRPTLREANGIVAAVGVSLLLLWPEPLARDFALVTLAITLLACALPLAQLWLQKARNFDLWQIAVTAPAIGAAVYLQMGTQWNERPLDPSLIALALAGLALFPAAMAWRIWRDDARSEELRCAGLASAAALTFGAALIVLPSQFHVFAAAAIAACLITLAQQRRETSLTALGCVAAGLTVLSALWAYGGQAATGYQDIALAELARAAGEPQIDETRVRGLGFLRWLAAAVPVALLAWRSAQNAEARFDLRELAEIPLAILIYIAAAQIVPLSLADAALAWVIAALSLGAAWLWRSRRAGAVTGAVLAGLWTLVPAFQWLSAGAEALMGQPMLAKDIPGLWNAFTRIAPFAVTAAALPLIWRSKDGDGDGDEDGNAPSSAAQRLGFAAAGLAAVIGLHMAFKQVFAIETLTRFVELGLLERTVWQGLLLLGGWALLHFGKSRNSAENADQAALPSVMPHAGKALILASLAHFGWFTLALHNPLWDEQALGTTPIANLALPAYGFALAGLYALHKTLAEGQSMARIAIEASAMALITVLALTLLRQIFAGSILPPQPMGGTEDLLRSLVGIVLAIAFLIWGARSGIRSWRIGSLALMVLAVAKVFLIDAAGLEGLLRIASFMALGFSLIGIGWLYSRQLASDKETPA